MALDLRRLGRALVRSGSTAIERLTVSLEPARQSFRSIAAESFKRPPTGELEDLPLTVWSEWTIARIRNANQALVLGNFGPAGLLTEAMLGDDRIGSSANGRIKGTTKCDAVFTPSEADTSGEVAKVCEDLWEEILPLDVEELILTWSTFLGFSLAEKIWEAKKYKGRDLWVPRLKPWHPYYIYFDNGRRQYVAIAMGGLQYVEPTGDPKWFLFTPWGYYRGWIRGGVRSVAIPWVVRQYALRDWGRFSEKHGLPMVVAKVPAQAPAEDKARFFTSIKNLGADTGLQLPVQAGKDAASWDVQLLEARDTSWKAFPGLIQTCDQSITLSLRGTNLTTQVEGGSYAASQTHREEDSDLAISDRKKLATALRAQVLREFVTYNFGSADLVPELEFVSPESDPASEAKVMLDVASAIEKLQGAKVPVDIETLSQQFGIPLKELPPEEKAKDSPVIPLTPSDSAAIVTVDEARGTMKLGPWPVPEDGKLSLEQFRNKPAEGSTPEVPPGSGSPPGQEPKPGTPPDGSGTPTEGLPPGA
jgi:hypothetical protein